MLGLEGVELLLQAQERKPDKTKANGKIIFFIRSPPKENSPKSARYLDETGGANVTGPDKEWMGWEGARMNFDAWQRFPYVFIFLRRADF
jgi:hypothetical protein